MSRPITVAELIEALRKAPQDHYVLCTMGDCGDGFVKGIDYEVRLARFEPGRGGMMGDANVWWEWMARRKGLTQADFSMRCVSIAEGGED